MERGVVEVEGGTVRRKQYYLTERLYNIYYLLRRRHRADFLIEALIHFMESYYSPSELKDIGAGIIREMESFSAEMCAFHQIALTRLMESPALAGHREDLLAMVTKDSARVLDRDIAPPDTVRRAQVGVEPDEGDGCHPHDADSDEPVELEVANRLFDEAIGLRNQNRAEESIGYLQRDCASIRRKRYTEPLTSGCKGFREQGGYPRRIESRRGSTGQL